MLSRPELKYLFYRDPFMKFASHFRSSLGLSIMILKNPSMPPNRNIEETVVSNFLNTVSRRSIFSGLLREL